MAEKNIDWEKLSEVEQIKYKSDYLKGTLQEGLENELSDAIAADDCQVSKFHGIYLQYDRDTASERKRAKLEPDYSFLVRVRVPGGIVSAEQWLSLDKISDEHANGTLKLTTRQAFQFHGVIKRNLKPTIKQINQSLLDTIAACGDVNRNVMASPHPFQSNIFDQVQNKAKELSSSLTPSIPAYYEIWLDKTPVAKGYAKEVEPIYGATYLPRKFKIGFAIPPYNDTDVYTQDIGFVAIEENKKLAGFNVVIGGGMGSTFGDSTTYPKLGDVIGFVSPDKLIETAKQIVLLQKEHGNRQNRKNARLKYTIDRLGLDNFTEMLATKQGYELEQPRQFSFSRNGDKFGWTKASDNKWYLTLFVEGGRVRDTSLQPLKSALAQIAKLNISDFRLTGNQNLILGNVSQSNKSKINSILKEHKLFPSIISGIRANSIACVALNTCVLAFAEAERYLPSLIDKIEELLKEYGLLKDEIVIRMTGCPNGCGRPYVAEIGFIGKAPGSYNLYLGGSFNGDRLNALYKENIDEQQILAELKPLFKDYSENRENNERFGDFAIRKNYVPEMNNPKLFKH